MRLDRRLLPLVFLLLGALAAPSTLLAQGDLGLNVALFAGIGGSPDSDGTDGAYSLLVGLETVERTHIALRVGHLDLDLERPAGPRGYELDYATLTAEYRVPTAFYESGLYLGLGLYDLEPELGEGEDAVGITAGVTGNFKLSKHWSAIVDLGGHYADLDAESFFFIGQAGLSFHF